jgi:flagellar protein FlaG
MTKRNRTGRAAELSGLPSLVPSDQQFIEPEYRETRAVAQTKRPGSSLAHPPLALASFVLIGSPCLGPPDNGQYPVVMTPNQAGPRITLNKTTDYRENYANSVQVRVNLWDFFLSFGLLDQNTPENVQIHNFQGIFLSPQQAKALANVLNQNLSQYESAFGEIRLEPQAGSGIIQ